MSYNTTIKSIEKKDFDLIKNFTTEKEIIDYVNLKNNDTIKDDEIYLAIRDIGENVLQIDGINEELEKKISKKIFINDNINNLAKNYGHQLFMIEKNDLLLIIKHYQSEIIRLLSKRINRLNSVLKVDEETKEKGLIDNKENYYVIKDIIKLFDWKMMEFGYREEGRKEINNYFPNLCLNKKDDDNYLTVSNSQLLEYEIFNLVALYNNFDFENKVLIIEAS